jgi:hypothetical protein
MLKNHQGTHRSQWECRNILKVLVLPDGLYENTTVAHKMVQYVKVYTW